MTNYPISSLRRPEHLPAGGVPGRFAQVKEEPATRAGDTEQSALALRLLAALVVALAFTLSTAAQALQVTDDRGVVVTLAQPPQRIVSLLPSLTETVCELGQCQRLVGVDRYSDYPPSVQKLPQVGGGLDPNIEGIVALKPDVVLMATSSPVSYTHLDVYKRQVPLFKINPRATWQIGRQPLNYQHVMLHFLYQAQALLSLPHHGGHLKQHVKNLGHAALVEDGDLHPGTNQGTGDVGLHV